MIGTCDYGELNGVFCREHCVALGRLSHRKRRCRRTGRLRIQHEAWAPDTAALLDEIGVGAGWKCLDLGCGPFGLTRVLADTVGPTGYVIGLEYNDAFVAAARLTDAELDEAVADCRAFLSRPDSLFVSPQLVQVWGRKPV